LFPSLLGLRYLLRLVPYPARLTFSTLFQLVRTNLPQCCPIIDNIIMQYFDYFYNNLCENTRFVAWKSATTGGSNSGTSPTNIHGSY
jgi:hypothetical protein